MTIRERQSERYIANDVWDSENKCVRINHINNDRQVNHDIVMHAYENIIDIIGAENILCFLPMWDKSGTVLYDLLRPGNVQFSVVGVSLDQPGLLHNTVSMGGSGGIIQKGITENLSLNATLPLATATDMEAQKLPANLVGEVRSLVLALNLMGSLPSAKLTAEIWRDIDGVPGEMVATSNEVVCSGLSNTIRKFIPFEFSEPFLLLKNRNHWLVLKYSVPTGVDASNYVTWDYDNSGTYGQPRAYHDGTAWTVTSGQSHYFCLYNNSLYHKGDFTAILVAQPILDTSWRSLFALGKSSNGDSRNNLEISGQYGYIYPKGFGGISDIPNMMTGGVVPNVFGVTYSSTETTGKLLAYKDGVKVASVDGVTSEGAAISGGVAVGARFGASTSVSVDRTNSFKGSLGTFIFAKKILTDAEMGKITNQLNAMRRFGVLV